MRIISLKPIKDFWKKHSKAEGPLSQWIKIIEANDFENFAEVKKLFPSADQVKKLVVFNIGGNKYRLIALLQYKGKRLYVRAILTHKEYDKEKWKEDSWFNSKK